MIHVIKSRKIILMVLLLSLSYQPVALGSDFLEPLYSHVTRFCAPFYSPLVSNSPLGHFKGYVTSTTLRVGAAYSLFRGVHVISNFFGYGLTLDLVLLGLSYMFVTGGGWKPYFNKMFQKQDNLSKQLKKTDEKVGAMQNTVVEHKNSLDEITEMQYNSEQRRQADHSEGMQGQQYLYRQNAEIIHRQQQQEAKTEAYFIAQEEQHRANFAKLGRQIDESKEEVKKQLTENQVYTNQQIAALVPAIVTEIVVRLNNANNKSDQSHNTTPSASSSSQATKAGSNTKWNLLKVNKN